MANPETLYDCLDKYRAEFCYSGAQLAASTPTASVSVQTGKTSYFSNAAAVTKETLFDIGSVTKAVCTASIFARLVDSKRLSLTTSLADLCSELPAEVAKPRTLGQLLCHASGAAWWVPYFSSAPAAGLRSYLVQKAESLFSAPSGTTTVYSDVGYWYLGFVLQNLFPQLTLAQVFESEVLRPLGLKELKFGPVPQDTTAATEVRDGKPQHGVVFDENAAAMGGVSAHAGLFSTADSLCRFGEAWLAAVLGKSPWLSAETARVFTQPAGETPENSTWSYGFDGKSTGASSSGRFFSPKAFGILGYPGASLWVDPEHELVVAFLTNRVHPSRLDERIRKVRPIVHDAVYAYFFGEKKT